MDGQGGISLGKQLHILDFDPVRDPFKPEADWARPLLRVRVQEIIPERLFLPSKGSQGQAGGDTDGALGLRAALSDLFGDGREGEKIIVIVLGLVPQNGLAASAAHIELPFKLQCVLQGVWFAGIQRDSRRERKVPGFDGGIAVVDADVHVAQLLMF